MDNSHIFWVSQQCRSLLLPQPLWLPLPRGLLTKRRVLDVDQRGSMCKQVHTHAHTHTPYTPFSTPKKWQGIWKKEKRQQAFEEWPLFHCWKLQKSNGVLLQLKVTAQWPQWNLSSPVSPFSTRQTTSGKEWYRAFKILSGTPTTCKQDAANENKGLPWSLPNQPSWSLLGPGEGSTPPKPLGHSCF